MGQLDRAKIRSATSEDVVLLSELSTVTFQSTFGDENTPEDMDAYLRENFSSERLRQELTDPIATFFIAELSGEPVGYARLNSGAAERSVSGAKPIELVRLYVLAQNIGQGIGTALMQECIRNAKSRGFETLWLGVWEHNLRARAFYRKLGFEEAGSHVFQLGNDAQTDLILQKSLSVE